MAGVINDDALDVLFREGRTYDAFIDRPVPDDLLCRAYDLARMTPTSANCQPMRILFVRSDDAKQKMAPALSSTNREKSVRAPVTAIIAQDLQFYEKLPRLYRVPGAEKWFTGQAGLIAETAFRNASMQGASFMLAARAVGLDVGPMSGFDNAKIDEAFFAGTSWKSNFLCNLGFGDPVTLPPRDRRLDFDEACRIV